LNWEHLLDVIKRQIKVVPVHIMKAYRGSRGIAPLIPNLGIRWRWMFSFTLQLLYCQGKRVNPRAEVDDFREEKNLLHQPGIKPQAT
jgi:hypothetical protein